MKIKVKDESWQVVKAMKPLERQRPTRQSGAARFLMKTLSKGELKAVNFRVDEIRMDEFEADCREKGKRPQEVPCLILMNHSSFTDLNIAATLFADRQYHIVCTNDGFVGKEGLMRWAGCMPTCKFIGDTRLIRDIRYCLRDLKSSIIMYPEASYSFDGTATELPESVGKLIKLLKVPVIMVRTHGAFLRDPLYNNLQKRKVDVTADVIYLLSEEEAARKSTDKINEILKEAFSFDHFREQQDQGITIDEPFRADGLHRVLYKCPVCGAEGEMEGRGIGLTCHHCGASWQLESDGRLTPMAQSAREVGELDPRFSHIPDWYQWERECVRKELQSGTYRLDEDVEVMVLKDFRSIYRVGKGRLVHSIGGFSLTGTEDSNRDLDFFLDSRLSYSLYADYFWYELGDMISIGDPGTQYYCFPTRGDKVVVAKARLATEELCKMR